LNLEVHLFGDKPVNTGSAESNQNIHDHVNQTNISELAALLDQMDLVLGIDSFVAHLSSLLGKRTLVLLSSTGDDYFHHYTSTSTCSSQLSCAPCFHVSNTCPLGHDRCAAFYHESMDVELLSSWIVKELTGMYKSNYG
jgi:ADP-heptose:LPS heptosyltransferase